MDLEIIPKSAQPERPFVNFHAVNQDTNLQSLNLNWAEADLPEKERTKHVHRLHPYLGKFIPQLVEIFLRKFRPRLVYDPFCGSGTTLVEASVLGIDSIGTDISAFNVLLAGVKTKRVDATALVNASRRIFQDIKSFDTPASQLSFFSNGKSAKKDDQFKEESYSDYLREWFAPQSLKELLQYKKLTDRSKYSDFFKIILSRAARSARLVRHFDLDWPKIPQTEPYYCYKHSRICSPVQSASQFLRRYTEDAVRRVSEYQVVRSEANVRIIHGDSRKVELPYGIDMVFTSPPYVGLIDYHEQHRYAYELLDLEDRKNEEIGPAKRGTSKNARNEYIAGVNAVLEHTRSFMAPNAIMAIVVNDKYELYNAAATGFVEIGRVRREVNRRTGRRKGVFYEDILIWRKT